MAYCREVLSDVIKYCILIMIHTVLLINTQVPFINTQVPFITLVTRLCLADATQVGLTVFVAEESPG